MRDRIKMYDIACNVVRQMTRNGKKMYYIHYVLTRYRMFNLRHRTFDVRSCIRCRMRYRTSTVVVRQNGKKGPSCSLTDSLTSFQPIQAKDCPTCARGEAHVGHSHPSCQGVFSIARAKPPLQAPLVATPPENEVLAVGLG